MKHYQSLIQHILPYGVLLLLGIFSYFQGSFAGYSIIFFFVLLALILKDIFLLFHDIPQASFEVIDYEGFKKNGGSPFQIFIIRNRKNFFPALLVGYILILLLKQTQIFGLADTFGLNYFNENILLIGCIISGIFTLFYDEIEDPYTTTHKSGLLTVGMIFLTFGLAILGAYIILLQTQRLGNLSYIISFVSGILIFLVSLMIQEEEKEQNSPSSNTDEKIL